MRKKENNGTKDLQKLRNRYYPSFKIYIYHNHAWILFFLTIIFLNILVTKCYV